MPRINGKYVEAFKNSLELSNGNTLTISYTAWGGGNNDPDADSSEVIFSIKGTPVLREELPPEVTASVIEELIFNASRDNDYDFGGSDPD